MAETVLVAVVASIILIALVARRRTAWPGNLRRLHAGVRNRAEWMAPDEVVHAVEADYLAAHNWTADAVLSGYTRFLAEAPQYYTGNYLKRQRKIVSQHMQSLKSGVRFIGVLRSLHRLRVRHFSDDGLSCYIVDYQTKRRMLTYEYWQLHRVHAQVLTPAAYVFRMVYDKAAR